MIISVTERGTFRRCRTQWDYTSASRQSLQSSSPRTAFSLGSNIHTALAQWLIEPEADPAALYTYAAAEYQRSMKEAYKARVGADMSDSELQPLHDGFELGLAMMKNYRDQWHTPLFKGYTIVQPETQIEVRIPDTDHTLTARLDGIIRQNNSGDLYIIEHKTYSARPQMQSLQMNDQFLAYVWAVTQLDFGRVAGIAYDGMWKRAQPPRNSTFEDLFIRALVMRPQYEVQAFANQLRLEVNDMEYARTHNAIYPNRRWEGCYDCQFDAVCAAKYRGEDEAHMLQQNYVRVDADKNATLDKEE